MTTPESEAVPSGGRQVTSEDALDSPALFVVEWCPRRGAPVCHYFCRVGGRCPGATPRSFGSLDGLCDACIEDLTTVKEINRPVAVAIKGNALIALRIDLERCSRRTNHERST
jgi:hypothetical protein